MTPTQNIAGAERLGREYEISCGRSDGQWHAYGFGTMAEMYKADVARLERENGRLRRVLSKICKGEPFDCGTTYGAVSNELRRIRRIARDAVELSVTTDPITKAESP